MTVSVLAYRLFRLRRLILVSLGFPVLVVCLVAAFKGMAAFALLALAIGGPLAHILRYPTAWMETIVVSLVTGILLALAGTIGPEVGLAGLAVRIAGLGLLGLALFFVLSGVLPSRMIDGPARPHTSRARRTSRLPPEDIKAAITIYPGREDARVTCGAPDEDGAFLVTIHQRQQTLGGDSPSASFDIEMFAQVLASTPDSHEVMCVEAPVPSTDEWGDDLDPAMRAALEEGDARAEDDDTPPAVTVSRHEFRRTRRGGTRVAVAETGAVMSRGMAFGFWVQDYFADHLTDEIDRAEGRPPRANRSTDQAQMIVDIARLFIRSDPPVRPAE